MKKKLKRSTKQYIMVSFLSVLVISSVFLVLYFTIIKNIKVKYLGEIQVLTRQLETKEIYVYEAIDTIPLGSRITRDQLNYIKSYSEQDQNYYMSESDMGKVALIEVKAGTYLLKDMLTENKVINQLREIEFGVFQISSNMVENDYVDIRILFPNGEDYVVLSKKNMKHLSIEKNQCFLWLDEEEILRISAAIVDAYLYSGAKLYTAKYIEPSIQLASLPTYLPSLHTLELLETDSNLISVASQALNEQMRKEMENRLSNFLNQDASDILWEMETNSSENDSNFDVKEQNSSQIEEEVIFYDLDEEGDIEYGE